jgi:hypothetical protein
MADPFSQLIASVVGRLGMQPQDRRPQTALNVNVTAPRPAESAPYPKNLLEILLGTQTKPPTGVYTNPNAPAGQIADDVPPYVRAAWADLQRMYPFITRSTNLERGATPKGGAHVDPLQNTVYWDDGMNPGPAVRDRALLAHELTHIGQARNTMPNPNDDELFWRTYVGSNLYDRVGRFAEWHDRLGEQQAQASGDLYARLLRDPQTDLRVATPNMSAADRQKEMDERESFRRSQWLEREINRNRYYANIEGGPIVPQTDARKPHALMKPLKRMYLKKELYIAPRKKIK